MEGGDQPNFDPAAPANPAAGIFGIGRAPKDCAVHLIPVPFEATASYGTGTSFGPEAIVKASGQLDLFDIDNGRPYEVGICMLPELSEIQQLDRACAEDRSADVVNAASARVNELVRAQAEKSLDQGCFVGVVGGDHASPFGLIETLAARHPGMGILHIDAHHDLRQAYEGYTWSHASILYNVVTKIGGLGRVVQVGVRDFAESEKQFVEDSERRIVCFYDQELRKAGFDGQTWTAVCELIVAQLPQEVYISFDIDGLDPKLCPDTGTPVPGGLDFEEALHLLRLVVESGRKIVGFDLCEVAPGTPESEWDANVGARLLYKLIGFGLRSRQR
ncbi:MAG: agmatinase family protein [Planctomycetota bacterium]